MVTLVEAKQSVSQTESTLAQQESSLAQQESKIRSQQFPRQSLKFQTQVIAQDPRGWSGKLQQRKGKFEQQRQSSLSNIFGERQKIGTYRRDVLDPFKQEISTAEIKQAKAEAEYQAEYLKQQQYVNAYNIYSNAIISSTETRNMLANTPQAILEKAKEDVESSERSAFNIMKAEQRDLVSGYEIQTPEGGMSISKTEYEKMINAPSYQATSIFPEVKTVSGGFEVQTEFGGLSIGSKIATQHPEIAYSLFEQQTGVTYQPSQIRDTSVWGKTKSSVTAWLQEPSKIVIPKPMGIVSGELGAIDLFGQSKYGIETPKVTQYLKEKNKSLGSFFENLVPQTRGESVKDVAVYGIGGGITKGTGLLIRGAGKISPVLGSLTKGSLTLGGAYLTGSWLYGSGKEFTSSPTIYGKVGVVTRTAKEFTLLGLGSGVKGKRIKKIPKKDSSSILGFTKYKGGTKTPLIKTFAEYPILFQKGKQLGTKIDIFKQSKLGLETFKRQQRIQSAIGKRLDSPIQRSKKVRTKPEPSALKTFDIFKQTKTKPKPFEFELGTNRLFQQQRKTTRLDKGLDIIDVSKEGFTIKVKAEPSSLKTFDVIKQPKAKPFDIFEQQGLALKRFRQTKKIIEKPKPLFKQTKTKPKPFEIKIIKEKEPSFLKRSGQQQQILLQKPKQITKQKVDVIQIISPKQKQFKKIKQLQFQKQKQKIIEKPLQLLKEPTKSKQRLRIGLSLFDKQKAKQKPRTLQLQRPSQKSDVLIKQSSNQLFKPSQIYRTDLAQPQLPQLKQPQRSRTPQRIKLDSAIRGRKTTKKKRDKQKRKRSILRRGKAFKQMIKYQASFTAKALGIKAKKEPEKIFGGYSFGIRPIIDVKLKPSKKKKKGKDLNKVI